jgi:hypothetical protein
MDPFTVGCQSEKKGDSPLPGGGGSCKGGQAPERPYKKRASRPYKKRAPSSKKRAPFTKKKAPHDKKKKTCTKKKHECSKKSSCKC